MILPSNIEIKAKTRDFAHQMELAQAIAGGPGAVILQEDIFFCVLQGRLKLRLLSPKLGELIYYERKNAAGPKTSDYLISQTSDPEGLRCLLSSALGELGIVRKRRTLFYTGQTRIHLDEVEGLGCFLELEVVLQFGQSAEAGAVIAKDLMKRLEIAPEDLIEGAYLDLLLPRQL
ncbi:MAG: class IV adenylate cyclase [Candidatus Omnitrophota bacterium]